MSNFNRWMNGQQSGRGRGWKQNYNQSWAMRGGPSGRISEWTRINAYVPKKVLGLPASHSSLYKNMYTSTSAENYNGWNREEPSHSSWSDDDLDSHHTRGTSVFHPNLDLINNNDVVEQEPEIVPVDVLPDDLQERILASLPLVGLFKARSVCKKWNQIIRAEKFVLNDGHALSRKPWYYMFTSSDEQMGYLYDSGLGRWYNFELLFFVGHTWAISSSGGLSCFMDEENGVDMYVCNPITAKYAELEKPSVPGFAVYTALAFSVDRSNLDYTVIVIRSMQASEDFHTWNVAIHIYPSEKKAWLPPLMGIMEEWRPGNVAVICNGVVYFLAYSTGTGDIEHTHGVMGFNFIDRVPVDLSEDDTIIHAPCPLTCGRLMNVQDKLVLVGGIARRDRPGVIRGVGIWVLVEGGWEKITRMPNNIWQGFGEFDDVFASSGAGDLIYIQSYGGTILAVFDMNSKEWSWSYKCPMLKKFPLQIFSGFCFEPNLKVCP